MCFYQAEGTVTLSYTVFCTTIEYSVCALQCLFMFSVWLMDIFQFWVWKLSLVTSANWNLNQGEVLTYLTYLLFKVIKEANSLSTD